MAKSYRKGLRVARVADQFDSNIFTPLTKKSWFIISPQMQQSLIHLAETPDGK